MHSLVLQLYRSGKYDLQRVVKTAQWIAGSPLPHLSNIYSSCLPLTPGTLPVQHPPIRQAENHPSQNQQTQKQLLSKSCGFPPQTSTHTHYSHKNTHTLTWWTVKVLELDGQMQITWTLLLSLLLLSLLFIYYCVTQLCIVYYLSLLNYFRFFWCYKRNFVVFYMQWQYLSIYLYLSLQSLHA